MDSVDFLLVITVFARYEALRANIDWKSAFLKVMGQFGPQFQAEEEVPYQPFFVSGKLE